MFGVKFYNHIDKDRVETLIIIILRHSKYHIIIVIKVKLLDPGHINIPERLKKKKLMEFSIKLAGSVLDDPDFH